MYKIPNIEHKGIHMLSIRKIALGFVLAMLSVHALAQNTKPYFEVGYTMLDVEASSSGITLASSPTILRFIAGTELSEGLAIEGMYGTSLSSDDITVNGIDVSSLLSTELKVKNVFGVYLKPSAKLNENLEVFGRFGYTKAKYSISVAQVGVSGSESSVSYGFGASYQIAKDINLSADYMSYVSDEADTDGITLAFKFHF